MHLVLGKLAVKPELRDVFRTYARSILAAERATPGNLGFDIYEDLGVENGYLIVERWQDAAALEAYTATDTYRDHEATLTAFLSCEPTWEEYDV